MSAILPERVFVGIGSNLEDPERQVRRAIEELASLPDANDFVVSPLYASRPWGRDGQPDFINAVAAFDTSRPPRALLELLLAIEERHGRRRSGDRWGPRTLDLDLLLHGTRRVREQGLKVPHPRLAERVFVLMPLADLAPDLELPGGATPLSLLERVGRGGCRRLGETPVPSR